MGTYRVVEVTSQNSQNGKKEITGDKTSNSYFFFPSCVPLEKSLHIYPSSNYYKKNDSA